MQREIKLQGRGDTEMRQERKVRKTVKVQSSSLVHIQTLLPGQAHACAVLQNGVEVPVVSGNNAEYQAGSPCDGVKPDSDWEYYVKIYLRNKPKNADVGTPVYIISNVQRR